MHHTTSTMYFKCKCTKWCIKAATQLTSNITLTEIQKSYPYLKLDPFVLSEDGLDFEINPHGGNKGRGERIVGIAEKEAGLAHRAVPDDEEFEHVVEVLVGSVFLPRASLCRHL